MISVAHALEIITAHRRDFGTENIAICNAVSRVLATDILADRAFPPFDRVTMDGVAISSDVYNGGIHSFKIQEIQGAGVPPAILETNANCIEIMTGAVLPFGCDAVVRYEDCIIDEGVVAIQLEKVPAGQNIHHTGTDAANSEKLVAAGLKITPAIIGIAATVGMEHLPVLRLPRIAVCSTGDELVAINAIPELHQIRRSNGYMLAAALMGEGTQPDQFHLPDDQERMKALLIPLLDGYDALLFSGAVSKGRFDYLPAVLASLGMETLFHSVAQKPGKPMLFGMFKGGPVVFGFPGNPVSTLVCYRIFFQSWLNGSPRYGAPAVSAFLTSDVSFIPAMDYHLPVTVSYENGKLMATPWSGANSGDLVSLLSVNAVITLPAKDQYFKKGGTFPLTWLSNPF